MPTINNIDGFVHTIANNPQWREAVEVHPLGKERPDRFVELVQLTQKKNRPVNKRLGTAQTETNQRLKRMDDHPENLEGNDYERKVAAGSWPCPQPVFNSTPTHMALTQNVPATRQQSPLSRGAGGIAKPLTPIRRTQAPRPSAVDSC